VSCSETAIFDQVKSFDNKTWSQGEQLVFEVDVDDTIRPYDFEITLRTTTDYSYSNLWIYISSQAPDDVTSKVAQRINIARPDGSWIGKASGTIVESKLIYRTQSFPFKGKYIFTIEQATQEDEIKNVLDLGLRIYPHIVK
jgi:gliding motility-associated lipoprotein GldH